MSSYSKKLRVFFVSKKDIKNNSIIISGQDFIHLYKVLRYQVGDEIHCKNFLGFIYHCRIQQFNKDNVVCQILSKQKIERQQKQKYVKLFLSIPRLDVLSSIVSKITELDVDELQLIYSERSYLKTNKKFNLERFQKISLESLKQCKRDIPLILNSPIKLNSISEEDLKKKSSNLLLWECEQKNKIENINLNDRINLLIGSEGGITQEEKSFLTEKLNFESISLSENILRVETAVLFALAKIL